MQLSTLRRIPAYPLAVLGAVIMMCGYAFVWLAERIAPDLG